MPKQLHAVQESKIAARQGSLHNNKMPPRNTTCLRLRLRQVRVVAVPDAVSRIPKQLCEAQRSKRRIAGIGAALPQPRGVLHARRAG